MTWPSAVNDRWPVSPDLPCRGAAGLQGATESRTSIRRWQRTAAGVARRIGGPRLNYHVGCPHQCHRDPPEMLTFWMDCWHCHCLVSAAAAVYASQHGWFNSVQY